VEKVSLALPICEFCRNFKEDGYNCNAFPDGIPLERMLLENDGEECANGYKYSPQNGNE